MHLLHYATTMPTNQQILSVLLKDIFLIMQCAAERQETVTAKTHQSSTRAIYRSQIRMRIHFQIWKLCSSSNMPLLNLRRRRKCCSICPKNWSKFTESMINWEITHSALHCYELGASKYIHDQVANLTDSLIFCWKMQLSCDLFNSIIVLFFQKSILIIDHLCTDHQQKFLNQKQLLVKCQHIKIISLSIRHVSMCMYAVT